LKIKSSGSEKSKVVIGNGIKNIREKLELNQEALAYALNLSRSLISYIESGKHLPPPETFVVLRTKYDVDLNALVEGKKKLFSNYDRVPDEGADNDDVFFYYFKNSEIFRYQMLQTMKKFMLMEKEIVLKEISMKSTRSMVE